MRDNLIFTETDLAKATSKISFLQLRYQQCVDSRMFNTHKPSNTSLDESKTRLVGHSDVSFFLS